jgi:branched-chain amino acid transport system substrate-binding protein
VADCHYHSLLEGEKLVRIQKPFALAMSLAVAIGVLSACGSSSKNTTPTTTQSAATSPPTSGSAPTSGSPTTSGAATGQPILLNMNTPLTGPITFPETKSAAIAAEDAINAAGGVQGRPIKVLFCDTQSATDPTPSLQCTNSAIANQNVVAEVGDYSSFGGETTPLLTAAGVADIAPVPLYAPQYAAANSFPLMASEAGGLGVCMVDQGAKSVGFAYIDIPGSTEQITFGNLFMEKGRGTSYAKSVPISLTVTDPTPQVTSLASYGGVSLGLAPTQVAQYLQVHQTVAPNQLVCDAYLSATPATLSSLGSAANGLYLVSGLPPLEGSNPGIAIFKAQMAKYSPGAILDEDALNIWLGINAFAQVANKTPGPITRASVLAAWQNLTSLQVDGLLPPDLNLKVSPLGNPSLARLTNVWVQYERVENGKVEPISNGYVDLLVKP